MRDVATEPARGAAPPISVVVVNYNGEQHLEPCLEAVFAQSPAPAEVLVIDNASTDGAVARLAPRFPQATWMALERNDGPCPARNLGLERARHEWVLLLDNDAVLAPGALAALLDAARARPDVCLLQPRSVFADEPARVHYDGGLLHYAGVFSLRNFYTPLAEASGRGSIEVPGAVSVALLARRDVLLRVGGFDSRFFILFEDLDLSLRLALAGERVLSVENAIVFHRGGTAGISFRGGADYPDRRAFLHSRNRWIVLVKNLRWRTLVVCAPALLLYESVFSGFALVNGSLLAHLRGKWAFLRGMGETLRARRDVQKLRRTSDASFLVGGPLTVTPGLRGSRLRRFAIRTLDLALGAWWRAVRGLAG